VNLLGIDSVMCPQQRRLAAWDRLRKDLSGEKIRTMSVEAPLSEVPRLAAEILKGQVRGRVVVNLGS
jgi:acrylyl-CoA reductase (NADPH)